MKWKNGDIWRNELVRNADRLVIFSNDDRLRSKEESLVALNVIVTESFIYFPEESATKDPLEEGVF